MQVRAGVLTDALYGVGRGGCTCGGPVIIVCEQKTYRRWGQSCCAGGGVHR